MSTIDAPGPKRPGCVTAYAILLWIGSAVYLVAGMFLFFSSLDMDLAMFGGVLALCLGLLALIPVAAGIGIWRMTMWGWWLVAIQLGLGIAGTLLDLVVGLFTVTGDVGNGIGSICGSLVGLGITGGILYWFIDNRHLFGNGSRTVTGPDGEVTKAAAERSGILIGIAVIGGGVAVLCLVSVVVIAILTLLGPQIANVFSQITFGLE